MVIAEIIYERVLELHTHGVVITSRLRGSSDIDALVKRRIIRLDALGKDHSCSCKLAFFLLHDLIDFQVSV
jgi:hypothetical protein